MLSDERFDALLSGEAPINEEEAIWLKNYRDKQHKAFLEMQARDEKRDAELAQANTEFYTLLKSTIPKSFFYKHPVSMEELKQFERNSFAKNDAKINTILMSPALRKLYLLPPKSPYGDEYRPALALSTRFLYKDISKKYGVNVYLKALEYKKYDNNDFIAKVEAIEKKYHTSIDSSFDIFYYLSDWEQFKS